MLVLSKTNQFLIGVVLLLLVFITRGEHFAALSHLPSASLAVFFLAGFYVCARWFFVALLAACVAIDYYAITAAGVSNYCVTPAYGFLLPAYGVLWMAGRWFSQRYDFSAKALLPLVGSVSIAAVVSELFSSGGFYFLGGRFENPTLAVFGERLMRYFPQQLEGLAIWLGTALLVHIAFALTKQAETVSNS